MRLLVRASTLALLSLASFAVLSCGSSPPAAPSTVARAETSKSAPSPSSGKTSADRGALDPSVSPCEDFYEYACGGWIKATEIPADESFWYRSFSTIHERNEQILRDILEAYARGEHQGEPNAKKLGDAYAACMDERAIESAGTKPLEPWLKAIDSIEDKSSLTKLLGRMQSELGVGVVFEETAAQDFGDASQVVAMIWQGGLGMPEREYYLETTPKMTEIRGKYEAHVAAMMKLAGEPEAKAKASAKKVIEIETALAKAWMSKEDRREPKKINHHATRAELAKLVPGLDWDAWLGAARSKDVAAFNVAQPEYMKAVAGMIDKGIAAGDWKTYLRWHLFRVHGDELGKSFVDEKFRWQQVISGAERLKDRWKRCVEEIDSNMGEALAQPFVKRTLGTEGKADTVAMIHAIEAAMRDNLGKLAWMDDATRKAALAKLGKIENKIAYPDRWRSYERLEVSRGEHLLNTQRASAFEQARRMAKVGKPVDRDEWQMSPPTVNAYYDAQLNEMAFPAGILQPPFYSPRATRATNFGAIGMVMGHELTHGFDDEGRQFDLDGNLKDWWSKNVNDEFERRAECVKAQFDAYTVLGDLHVNGKLTLGENIADLGGIKLTYRAFVAARAEATEANGELTPEQELFLGFAQGWCSKGRDEAMRHLVSTNPHAPPKFRVNGPLSNLPEFAQAFACKPGSRMVRKERCEVW